MQKEVDVQALITFFKERNCEGAIRLIYFLASPKAEGLLEIGSGTMDLDDLLSDPALTDNEKLEVLILKTYSFYIGSADGSITPLQSMEKLTVFFDKIPEVRRKRLNQALGELAAMACYEPEETSDEERMPSATIN